MDEIKLALVVCFFVAAFVSFIYVIWKKQMKEITDIFEAWDEKNNH